MYGGSDTIPFLGASDELRLHTLLDDHGLLDGRNKGRPEKDIYWENFNPGILGSVTQSGTENFLGYQYYAPFREAEQVFLNNLGMLPTMAQAAAIAGINQAAYNKALAQENMAWERMNAEYNMAQAELARSSAAGDSSVQGIQGTVEIWGTTDDLVSTATKADKGGVSPIGRAYQKHAGNPRRAGTFTGEVSGNAIKNTQNGMRYLDDIFSNANSTYVVKKVDVFGDILDVRLPDGTGARWTADGKKFIGFLEKYTR